MKEKQTIAGPFLKWVGGKGQLLKQLEALLPKELYEEEFTYIEPFVGGGAMLFFMLQHFPNIRNVVINDINRNLTEAYRVVKEQPDELVLNLKRIEQEYKRLSDEESRKDYFLGMRQTFNEEALDALSKTSLLFFLNRTCFNGLYRENSRGKFNVPFGSYSNPTICNPEVIYADSQLLNKSDVEILNGDFEAIAQHIDRRRLCFIYFDPPYRPLSSTSSFNSYVKEAFNDDEQRPPTQQVDDCPRCGRPDSRREADDKADEPHDGPPVLARGHQQHERPHHGHRNAGGHSLQYTPEQQQPKRWRPGNGKRPDDEQGKPTRKQPAYGEAP